MKDHRPAPPGNVSGSVRHLRRAACAVASAGVASALPVVAGAQNLGPIVFGAVLPGILLAAILAPLAKFGLLSLPTFRAARPRPRRFVGVGLLELAVWVVALPAGLAFRFQGVWVYEAFLPAALAVSLATGYLANHLAFHLPASRGRGGATAGSVVLVLLLALLLPVFIVASTLAILGLHSALPR